MKIWINNNSFNNITAGLYSTGGYNGAVFWLSKIGEMQILNTKAIDVSNGASTLVGDYQVTDGCGRFLCAVNH